MREIRLYGLEGGRDRNGSPLSLSAIAVSWLVPPPSLRRGDLRSPAKNRSATSDRRSDRNRSGSVVVFVLKLPEWILAKALPFSIVSAQRRLVVTQNTAEFGRIPGLVGEDWQRV